MAYQFFNPAPVYFDLLGIEPIMGGSITFYDKGTTTLRDTWSREEQGNAYLNTNPIILDAAGRSPVQIWMDGDYSYVIRDADGVLVREGDFTSGQTAGASIPSLVADRFLTNDGTNLLWQLVRQVPDPAGMNDRILGTDGANLLWVEKPATPEIPEPDVVVQTTPFYKLQIGKSTQTTKSLVLCGAGNAPATGGRESNSSITFGEAFATTPNFISCIPTSQSNAGGPMVPELTAMSSTGFTVKWTIAAGAGVDAKILNAVPYIWRAEGTKVVTE